MIKTYNVANTYFIFQKERFQDMQDVMSLCRIMTLNGYINYEGTTKLLMRYMSRKQAVKCDVAMSQLNVDLME